MNFPDNTAVRESQTRLKKFVNKGVLMPGDGMIQVTWQELKDLRDSSNLIQGGLYRVTDYQCTTVQVNTRSAGHQFDVVLLAHSSNKLAEEGWAMMHDNIYDVTFADGVTKKCWIYQDDKVTNIVDCESFLGIGGDYEITIYQEQKTAVCNRDVAGLADYGLTYNYFQNSKLEAWKVWYCLDNDIARFAWADNSVDEGTGVPNGRGVIYRLIDEFNNDIKYDFKNIQFKRKITNGQYDENGTETFCYTLNIWYNGVCQDASIIGNTLKNNQDYITGVYNNIFGYATAHDLSIGGLGTFTVALGNNVVLSIVSDGYFGFYSNIIGNNSYSNTIGNRFYNNTIGNNFYRNIIGIWFNSNSIEGDFGLNTIGNYFNNNTIGNQFNNNTVGNQFYNNTIGNLFNDNTIGNLFNHNYIGNQFYHNTIGNNFYGNLIGNFFKNNSTEGDFTYNTIGNYFTENKPIGNGFVSNTIGNNFYHNSIGTQFNSNTIGNGFASNTIGNGFISNSIGNEFKNNSTEGEFTYNTIGTQFNSNTIGTQFNSNTIGNGFVHNTIGDSVVNKNYGNNGVELATKS